MDFLDPKKKKAYNIRLFIGFVLIAIVLILSTTIIALITAGYNLDRKTGKIIQNGLVFINSQPVSSSIYVNGSPAGTTNARLELQSGTYSILLRASGYRDWNNSISLLGGSVDQLDYPFLFPTNPKKTSVISFSQEPSIFTESPDRHWILTPITGSTGNFNVIDATNLKAQIVPASIPNALLNHPGTNTLSVVEWSNDNQNVLLLDSFQGGQSFIMFDWSNPNKSFDVGQTFPGTSFTTVSLNNKLATSLYLYNQPTGDLSLGNVTTKVATPVLSKVLYFWPYGTNELVYTTPDTKDPSKAIAKIYYKGQDYTLKEIPIGTKYLLNIASYNGNSYVAVGSNGSNYEYIYLNPLSQLANNPGQLPLPYTLLVLDTPPDNLNFSASARFIETQSGNEFSIYDILEQTHYKYTISNANLLDNQMANWMDGNRLDVVSGGSLIIWDFDGTNEVTLTQANSDFIPAFSQSYDAVYTLIQNQKTSSGTTTTNWEVQRTSLIAGKP